MRSQYRWTLRTLTVLFHGKFIMGGGGGFLGNLQNGAKPVALHRGYATAATDAGHTEDEKFAAGGEWAYRNPERLVNFAHRGTHLTAATAKLITQAYYGKAIAYSYYSGTSGSGRLAMMESQRYPEDVADFLTVLEQWVEHGVAPTRIISSHVASGGNRNADEGGFSMPIRGEVDRTRPLCVYPDVAAYKGSGSIDDAANFVCRAR